MTDRNDAPASPTDEPTAPVAGRRWRREYAYLLAVGALVGLFAFIFFFLDVDLDELRRFGYLGIFLISLIGSASVILPLPGAAVVVSSGQFVDDVLGIPFWLVVGVVAALGETVGELTAYLAGVGGKAVIEDRPAYHRLERWMRKHGTWTIFALSVIPNPLFDIAGFMAGAVRMPLWRFLITVFIGKAIKNSVLALAGDASLEGIFDAFE
jgi:membrane protein YqaA with SNARE-associated domain